MGVVGELAPPPPGVEHLELIGAEQEAERPLLGLGTEGREGVDGPAGSVAGELSLVHVEPGAAADRRGQHGPPLLAGRPRRGPVDRDPGRHQRHRVQPEPPAGRFREPQMAVMDGVEGAAQDAEDARRARRVSLRGGTRRAAGS